MNKKTTLAFVVLLLILASCLGLGAPSSFAGSPADTITLDQLPLLPRNVSVHEFSSYNKTGVNGDGDWILYKEANGDSVIFDAVGPGCLRSFWQTCVSGDLVMKFYFDGETAPRYTIPAQDFYKGKHPDFPAPLNSFEKLGYWCDDAYAGNCFTPIPFTKSLKIAVQGTCSFHHIFYERYPFGTPVTTFTGKENRDYLLKAFKQQGEEIGSPTDAEVIRSSAKELKPGEQLELLNVAKAATVARIVLEGENSEEFVRQAEICMQWDEAIRPEVLAPIGLFFGPAVRPEEVRTLPTKVELLPEGRIRMTSYFRMPFWRKGHILLKNQPGATAKILGPVSAEVHLIPQQYPENETGYFCALYRDGRTEMARDWLFFDAVGTGRYVGGVQTMLGSHYCEGNEHFAVDGATMPQINGTGTEDYYLGCFWPNPNYNMPFAGCIGDIKQKPGTACYYRFHIEAPIPFYSALDARIQHGGNSDIVSHYQSLGFCYLSRRPVLRLTDLIDVANEASERAHSYQSPQSKITEELDASYVGNLSNVRFRDRGRTHESGEISFTAAFDPDNHGVRLRRRLDQTARQSADVYVDDKFAGTWYHADQNPHLRWFDSEYDLPTDLTKGKSELKIRLVVKQAPGYGPFTDFRYDVLTFTGK